ncbi:hypothetical protein, partial [Citrobacter freundii]
IRCHRQNMKTSIINGSEVSRLSVAIHPLSETGQHNKSNPRHLRNIKNNTFNQLKANQHSNHTIH